MDTSVLQHPVIARLVAALVTDRGGCVQYDQGGGGREILVAAGARLAASLRAPLRVVEAPALHDEVRATVAALEPTAVCTVLSADDAAALPELTGGVLAVHADVLRDPAVRQPLRDRARTADHLIVVRHAYSDTTLDALAGPAHILRIEDLIPSNTPSAPVRSPRQQALPRQLAEAATRLAAQIYALDQDLASATTPGVAEQMRLRRAGMVESLCIMLEVHHNTGMISPPLAEQVVAREGARRYRSKLADPDLTHWRLQHWARKRAAGPEQPAQNPGSAQTPQQDRQISADPQLLSPPDDMRVLHIGPEAQGRLDNVWGQLIERKQRLIAQLNERQPDLQLPGDVDYAALAQLMAAADADGTRPQADQPDASDRAAPREQHPPLRAHSQQQTATHQHRDGQGLSRG